MKGFKYQLKNISRDKMVILSFFLPIIMALAVNILTSGNQLNTASELRFALLENSHTFEIEDKLKQYGDVTIYKTEQELRKQVEDPISETIGIIYNSETKSSEIILTGDETTFTKDAANTITYALDKTLPKNTVTILPRISIIMESKYTLIALVMVTALFIGCTFNTMNIVAEKEDGISLINETLPLTKSEYLVQKIFLGFIYGVIVSIVTACICFDMTNNIIITIVLIMLSVFMTSIIGLYIGKFADNLMIAIIYIKFLLIIFIAVPYVAYVLIPDNKWCLLFNLIPSYPVFEGLMNIINNNQISLLINISILILHCICWFIVYIIIDKQK